MPRSFFFFALLLSTTFAEATCPQLSGEYLAGPSQMKCEIIEKRGSSPAIDDHARRVSDLRSVKVGNGVFALGPMKDPTHRTFSIDQRGCDLLVMDTFDRSSIIPTVSEKVKRSRRSPWPSDGFYYFTKDFKWTDEGWSAQILSGANSWDWRYGRIGPYWNGDIQKLSKDVDGQLVLDVVTFSDGHQRMPKLDGSDADVFLRYRCTYPVHSTPPVVVDPKVESKVVCGILSESATYERKRAGKWTQITRDASAMPCSHGGHKLIARAEADPRPEQLGGCGQWTNWGGFKLTLTPKRKGETIAVTALFQGGPKLQTQHSEILTLSAARPDAARKIKLPPLVYHQFSEKKFQVEHRYESATLSCHLK